MSLACLLVLLGLGALTGCTTDEPTTGSSSAPSTGQTSGVPTPTASPAKPAPRPAVNACYDLSYQQAVAPTNREKPVSCKGRFTAQTFFVGTLDAVVAGHLLAVDSARVQKQIATDCPRRLAKHLGGDEDDLRVSMFRTSWFSPTVQDSEAGQDWYRCDVIAIAADGKLAPLRGRLAGIMRDGDWRDDYGMCSAAEPGTRGFARVACSTASEWRAVATVPARGRKYPGADVLTRRDQPRCEDPARSVADNPLRVTWAYEAPTEQQWAAGQRWGTCWAPG